MTKAQNSEQKQITRQKQTTRPRQDTKQAQILNKPVEFDALVPFMKVWRSNSIG